jgi:single-strand DNA-binding protein
MRASMTNHLCPFIIELKYSSTAIMSVNIVTLVGRVGGDPDIKYFESGTAVCKLTLAVKRLSRNSDQPDWFNLELWDRKSDRDAQRTGLATVAANYVRKGSLIGVKGSLKIESWPDRNTGAQRFRPVILVEKLDLIGSKRDNDPNAVSGYADDEF